MLEYLQNNLWLVRQPLELFGMDFGTVMTIIKLKDSSLWIHSPVEPSSELLRHLDSLGNVTSVISPSNFHHLYAASFMNEFPDAHYYYSPGVEKKQRKKIGDITLKTELSENSKAPWNDEIEILKIGGMPFVNEFVFYHKNSQTLIASDLIFNLKKNKGMLQKIIFPIMGIKDGIPGQSRLFKSCIRDKIEYNKAINKLQSWDIRRVIIGHGGVIEHNPNEIIHELIAV